MGGHLLPFFLLIVTNSVLFFQELFEAKEEV